MNNNLTVEEAAKAIGGATTRAYHLTHDKTNRVLLETKTFEDVAMSATDGSEKKYSELLQLAEKFEYTEKVLNENNFPSALEELKNGIQWLREHKDESVDKRFSGYYMLGYSVDPYKSEVKIAREKAGLSQQQFAEMFGISLDTVKSWDCGRRRPDKLKEKLILEKMSGMKKE